MPLKFYMTGATRGEQDERLLGQLKKKIGELGLEVRGCKYRMRFLFM